MIELLVCASAVMAMTALALLPWPLLVQGGALLAAAGLLLGLPTGVAYHVQLRRELARCGVRAARWWLQPTAWHRHLDAPGQAAIRTMFRLGGAGCGVVFLGCFAVVIGLVRAATEGFGG